MCLHCLKSWRKMLYMDSATCAKQHKESNMQATIKTASDLKYYVEQAGHDSHFFTRKTMSFFGDTMRNYGVRKTTIATNYDAEGNYVGKDGMQIEVYELYRRNPVKHGLKDSAYFDVNTFKRVHAVK
jgi:hypothetical protein